MNLTSEQWQFIFTVARLRDPQEKFNRDEMFKYINDNYTITLRGQVVSHQVAVIHTAMLHATHDQKTQIMAIVLGARK